MEKVLRSSKEYFEELMNFHLTPFPRYRLSPRPSPGVGPSPKMTPSPGHVRGETPPPFSHLQLTSDTLTALDVTEGRITQNHAHYKVNSIKMNQSGARLDYWSGDIMLFIFLQFKRLAIFLHKGSLSFFGQNPQTRMNPSTLNIYPD